MEIMSYNFYWRIRVWTRIFIHIKSDDCSFGKSSSGQLWREVSTDLYYLTDESGGIILIGRMPVSQPISHGQITITMSLSIFKTEITLSNGKILTSNSINRNKEWHNIPNIRTLLPTYNCHLGACRWVCHTYICAGNYIIFIPGALSSSSYFSFWRLGIFLALIIVVCFVPYPHSQGESILQHMLRWDFSNCSA